MITLCWAAKGGSGTTVVAAALALSRDTPTLLVDMGGDQPTVFGVPDTDGPGLHDWIASSAPTDRLRRLEVAVSSTISLLPAGRRQLLTTGGQQARWQARWQALAGHLALDDRDVVVDIGTACPPAALHRAAHHRWLITRPCYLAVLAALRFDRAPSGIVLITEPGRALRRSDIEAMLGAQVVVEIPSDPAVARAVDSGLLVSRLPRLLHHELRAVA